MCMFIHSIFSQRFMSSFNIININRLSSFRTFFVLSLDIPLESLILLLANALAFLAACSFTRIFSITSFSSKRIITSLSISSSYAKFSRLFSTNSSSLYLKTTSSSKSSRYLFFYCCLRFS